MKVTKVSYSRLVNLGGYQNERFGMIAIVEDDETAEKALEGLKQRVLPFCGESANELENRRWDLQSQCNRLEEKLQDYQKRWNDAADFLRAQGIKPDAPNFPQFDKLLAPAIEEVEIVEEDDDDDNDDGDYVTEL